MAVNFTKNQDEITKAWREVVDSKDSPKWALFGYEGNTNNIKLMATGSNGLNGLVQELNCSLIQYAFCRVINKEFGLNKLVLVNWQGDSSPLARKGLCASHVGDVTNYFKGCTQTITIRNDDEASYDYLMEQILKTSAKSKMVPANSTTTSVTSFQLQTGEPTNEDAPELVGSIYKKTDINSEIPLDRKSFWQQQEEEEKARLVEEKKRAAEKQAQFERERKLREESEAKKLAETIKERDRVIEATRQAERLDSSSSQPSSILSTSNANQDDDDERVGRRSELIRLERNQETQSLISKGLIKNKRAIFEQASQQQQQQSQQQQKAGNMTRRTSGTIISQRLNTFKSLDAGNKTSGGVASGDSHTDKSVEKITNGLAKNADIDGVEREKSTTAVTKLVEAIKITSDSEQDHVSQTSPAKVDTIKSEVMSSPVVEARDIKKESPIKDAMKNGVTDSNGNVNHKSPLGKQSPVAVAGESDSIEANANYGIRARALYDYEAADHTEISFDPDDVIGFIEKVDEGWWQGSVVTGQYAGQTGLFPSNYVQELS